MKIWNAQIYLQLYYSTAVSLLEELINRLNMSAKHVDQVSKMANLVSNLPIAHKLTQIVQHINTKYPNFRPCFDPKWNAEIGDKELKLNLQNIGCYL